MSQIGRDRSILSGLETSTIEVEGLDCAMCAASIDRALRGVPGVEQVTTDVVSERVTVEHDARAGSEERLKAAIRGAGYRIRERTPVAVETYEVEGLCCATEAKQIEDRLASRPDVDSLSFDYVAKRMRIEGRIPPGQVESTVARLGMRARRVGGRVEAGDASARRGRFILVVLSGALWLAAVIAHYAGAPEAVVASLSVGGIITGGRYIVPRGLKAARSGALDMNFLMSIAAVGAILIGEYLEGASAMFLFALAQLLEAWSMDRARNAIRSLMDLSPTVATVMRQGVEQRVSADDVQVGEVVVVRPGEKIPLDGTVVAGVSTVNQAPITGESVPVTRGVGEEVFAGTLNGEGVLELRADKPAEDSTLARIIHSVEDAQAARAPSQNFVDGFARVYTPAVVVAALLVAIAPPLVLGGDWGTWFYRALVLLVVACPCALVISTPVTIVSALAGAARRGILVKGGLHLENAGRSTVIALDKTGTLTEGEARVIDVVPAEGSSHQEVIALATGAETRSDHPFARAILRLGSHEGIVPLPSTDTTAVVGKGIRATIGGRAVFVGNPRLFGELGAASSEIDQAAGLAGDGRTVIMVGQGGEGASPVHVLGYIVLSDRVREGAAEAVRDLRSAGIERIVMLTGDSNGTARAVAEAIPGIDEYRAELLPQDKVHAVRELREKYGRITFVGDGINDAPALAAADVGIAMGSAGTDIALETADIALMADDLRRIPTAVRMARKAERIIQANIAISLLTKGAFIALALSGFATLWMAVVADMGTSLLVTLNGMRAMRD